ncbi:DUF3298 and DUF4163 domain-containing protein [Candidatus Arthromitus sp. SFB-rat-Yit]|uniref:DUF3298 and DUF4163 domain-containing protein n=1 Tax=Candidatus Arthromitus sp. SFB-rat-Yit TaxID=1041504 RepID=UPI0003169FA8|nr:DUF3298 and DUF4163 domain-containing protein [Candidatus Arthromitus sp. SFB-rat-Yit]
MESKSLKRNVLLIIGSVLLFLILSFSQDIVQAIKFNSDNINVKTLEIKEDLNGINFDLKYPEIEYADKSVKDKINTSLKDQILEFKQYIEDIYKEFISSVPKELVENSLSSKFIGMSDFEYEIVDCILSVRLNLIQFTGGAHPMTYRRDFNFDLRTGNVLKFGDLFNEEGKKTYKDKVDSFIKNIINNNPDDYFPNEFKGIGDNVQYYLTKDNIVIFYQLYELAPYSSGIPEFKIPYSLFEGDIKINPSN